jgi:NADH:ubiquinone oxidoreductase subunit F (NADH-binding)
MAVEQMKIALRNCGSIDPQNIDSYIARGGYRGLTKALALSPEAVIEEVTKSGLRGRGGAGFPTGAKWLACRQAPGDEKYLVGNAHESDPNSLAGKTIIEGDPHSVLEGMAIGAYAAGASKGYIYIRKDYTQAVAVLKTAVKQMQEKGFAGARIKGSGFSFDIEIKEGEADFANGEETIMLHALEDKRAMAYPRPPYPARSGLKGQPTVVNNVETLAHVAAIMQQGAAWYAGCGTAKSKGTKVLTLSGDVRNPGVFEVPLGTTVRQVIDGVGGGAAGDIKMVEFGGPTGGFLPASALDIPIDYETLVEAGAIMGSGSIIVGGAASCPVDRAAKLMDFSRKASCGACVLCREGTIQIDAMLHEITEGNGKAEHIDMLQELTEGISLGALCGLGRTAPNPVLAAIRYFREEVEAHVKDKRCPAKVCRKLTA